MPQLDVYIICNMLYSVIFIFIITYMLNTWNLLILINLILRIRKLKISLDKKYIFKVLKESIIKLNLQFYKYILLIEILKLQILKKKIIMDDALDIGIFKKIL